MMSWNILLFIAVKAIIVPDTICDTIVSFKTNGTAILGRKQYTILDNRPFIAFYNIPFAEPPIGHLRFKVGNVF